MPLTISRPKDLTIFSKKLTYDRHQGQLFWKSTGSLAGWVDGNGYRITRVSGKLYRNHHIIWFLETGEWPKTEIDHKDNDAGNNKFSNLRQASRAEQGANQKLQARRKGKYKGVHQSTSGNYYIKIKKNGDTLKGLGTYTCPKEAALMYNYLAEQLFGEFANFNIVFYDVEEVEE